MHSLEELKHKLAVGELFTLSRVTCHALVKEAAALQLKLIDYQRGSAAEGREADRLRDRVAVLVEERDSQQRVCLREMEQRKAAEARVAELEATPVTLDIVFDSKPMYGTGLFKESNGDLSTEPTGPRNVRLGHWVPRDDGCWVLRVAGQRVTDKSGEGKPDQSGEGGS